MKRIFCVSVICLLVACFAFFSVGAIEASDVDVAKIKPVTFRVTSHLTPTHVFWTDFYSPMFKEIEKETDGKVKFNVFLSQELIPLGQESKALNDRVVDMAAPIAPTYEQTRMPLGEVTLLPLISSDPQIGAKAWALMLESDVPIVDGKTYSEFMFGNNNLKVFAPTISDKYNLSTVGKDFNSIDSIESMKLRVAARGQQIYSEKIGAFAVSMPAADLFDSLSRKALDGAFLWVSDWPSYGLQELFKYCLTGINLGHFPPALAMTNQRWDSLQPELQELITSKVEKFRPIGADAIIAKYDDVIEMTKGTTEFVNVEDLPEEVSKHLKKGMADTWMEYIEIIESENLPGKKVALLWRDCILEAGGEVPGEIKDLK